MSDNIFMMTTFFNLAADSKPTSVVASAISASTLNNIKYPIFRVCKLITASTFNYNSYNSVQTYFYDRKIIRNKPIGACPTCHCTQNYTVFLKLENKIIIKL